MASVVGLWMAIAFALHLGSVAYLLTGVPLTTVRNLLSNGVKYSDAGTPTRVEVSLEGRSVEIDDDR